ncbi:hypothetical protein V3390_04680 [Luteimonas sp. FXH3W]|uniref:Uncharacterized protein n=1 Tax=Aquilutibacter rugosus TaxID=3115820 RepID=A0ABU7UZT9_9GAMM
MSGLRTLLAVLLGWAISLGVAQSAFAQNYARYCARDTDQLANDLTLAITSQDANYLATLYNWAGFSADTAYQRMDRYAELVEQRLESVDPLWPGMTMQRTPQWARGPLLAVSAVLLAWFQSVPPVDETPEIGPYPDPTYPDERGLGDLPPLPQEAPEEPLSDTDTILAESRRRAAEFDRNLQQELDRMAAADPIPSSPIYFGEGIPVASAIRVITEEGRIRPRRHVLTFKVMRFEDCYWLTGG